MDLSMKMMNPTAEKLSVLFAIQNRGRLRLWEARGGRWRDAASEGSVPYVTEEQWVMMCSTEGILDWKVDACDWSVMKKMEEIERG
ncbi:hypothetical protein RYX36_001088 [Vicia faba]